MIEIQDKYIDGLMTPYLFFWTRTERGCSPLGCRGRQALVSARRQGSREGEGAQASAFSRERRRRRCLASPAVASLPRCVRRNAAASLPLADSRAATAKFPVETRLASFSWKQAATWAWADGGCLLLSQGDAHRVKICSL